MKTNRRIAAITLAALLTFSLVTPGYAALSEATLSLGNIEAEFSPGNFPAEYEAEMGTTDVNFYINLRVNWRADDNAPMGYILITPQADNNEEEVIDDEDYEDEDYEGEDYEDEDYEADKQDEKDNDEPPTGDPLDENEQENEHEDEHEDEPLDEKRQPNEPEDQAQDQPLDDLVQPNENQPLDDNATQEAPTENTYEEAPQPTETLLTIIAQALGLRPITVYAAALDMPTEFELHWYQNNSRRDD